MTGSDLKRLRLAAGLTQHDLAERLGVRSLTVSRWERRRGLPIRELYIPAIQAALEPQQQGA